MTNIIKKIAFNLVVDFCSQNICGNEITSTELDSMFMQEMTTIASGYLQETKKASSNVTIITKDDIERIGAITIEEVLETIPGVHVNFDNGFTPSYNIRGINSSANSSVLIYQDGININTASVSTAKMLQSHLARNIERIEIVKGPSSALYGANAFSGVINIITKKNIGTDFGTFVGSHDTYGGWLNYGLNTGDFKVLFSAQGQTSTGSNRIVAEDRQTQFDRLFGTHASLAPGPINRGLDAVDIKLEVKYKDLVTSYFRYIRNKDYGMGIGFAESLDNSGTSIYDGWITGLKFSFGPDDLKTHFNVDYIGHRIASRQNILPAGAIGGLFKEPATQDFDLTTHAVRTSVKTVYSGIDNHKLYVGLGFNLDNISTNKDNRNFKIGFNNLLIPVGKLQPAQNIGDTPVLFPQTRYTYYGFIQDEWTFLNDWSLTAGVRVDYFSDFGWTVNPRTSLVWNASSTLTTKLMYGRAFRAPSFFELYTNKGIFVTGNSNLNPETINSLELSIEKRWPFSIDTTLNLFWNETENLIAETRRIDPVTKNEQRFFVNSTGATIYGLEALFKYQLSENFLLNVNYTYLNTNPNGLNDQFVITTPNHEVYAEIDWKFLPKWTMNLRSTSVLSRKRATLDNRLPVKDYTKLDFVLRYQNIFDVMDVTFKINNLTDVDARDPSINGVSIPFDYPLDDRSFMGIISLNL